MSNPSKSTENPLPLPIEENPTERSEWIKSDDLKHSTHVIHIINNTSHMAIDTSEAELVELAENGLTVMLPQTACAQGHMLEMSIARHTLHVMKETPPKQPLESELFKMQVTAKVTKTEKFTPETKQDNNNVSTKKMQLVTVTFIQGDMALWCDFLKTRNERQDEIQEIVKRIRG